MPMVPITEIIILGGGLSISEGISLGLKDLIKDKCTLTINYAYKHFSHTLMVFGDYGLYVPLEAKKENKRKYPDIYEELKKEPLIIYANDKNNLGNWQLPNTLFIKTNSEYNTNPLKQEFYNHFLSGIYTLSLAQFLLDYKGTIFLLGYDFGSLNKKDDNIHYYTKEEINHKGINNTAPYTGHNPNQYFGHFKEPNIKIYNVSPNSNITNFEKIDYKKMFELLSIQTYNQEELRQEIKNKLK
jgi:hypothetical protein